MPIGPGTRLGPYEIVAAIGAGGMGEVYRARDARLGREIALKVLPADVAADPMRRQRFEQEARAAGALNHPNILAIYDVGTVDGVAFLVSELVDGEPLRNPIERGPLGVRKVLDIAVQLADGLAAAHAAGIVHRDLKPENVMLTREGRVKILDFGLAKQTVVPARAEGEATLTVLNTQAGVILGTVSYMSPEQARGLAVDFRSDQFSFALILYELLTGRKAFQRETAAETMAAILREEPAVANTPLGSAPAPLRWIVERCLAKDPVERYSHTSDLYRELRGLRDHLTETVSQSSKPAAAAARPRRKALASAACAAVLAGFAAALLLVPPDMGMEQYRFVPFATEEGFETGAAWSPDGQTIAYTGEVDGVSQIFTRSLHAPTALALTKSPHNCSDPFWSPDGTRIFFQSGSGGPPAIWSVGVAGGAPRKVLSDVFRAALSPDGRTLAFLRYESMDATTLRLGLWISSPPGAPPRKFEPPPLAGMHYYNGGVQFSPDGKTLGLWMLMWDGRPEFWLIPFPAGLPRQPFLSWKEWIPIDQFRWMPDSRQILFAYRKAGTSDIHLWMADTGNGRLQPVTSGTGNETNPAVSPDGHTIAFTAYERQGDLVSIPLDGQPMRPILASARNEHSIEWAPDGVSYAFVTDRSGAREIWLAESRSGRRWPLVTQKDFGADTTGLLLEPAFSPDGQRIAYTRYGSSNGKSGAIWISAVAGGTPIRAVGETEDNPQGYPSWSPDGNSIAFVISRSGVVAVATAAVGGGARPVILKEKAIDSAVKWSPRQAWILYRTPEALCLISPDGKTDKVLSNRKWNWYAWSKEGDRVYAIRGEKRHYTLAEIAAPGGAEKTLSEFDLPLDDNLGNGLSLAPDGKSVAATVYHAKADIWLLEDFRPPSGIRARLWRW